MNCIEAKRTNPARRSRIEAKSFEIRKIVPFAIKYKANRVIVPWSWRLKKAESQKIAAARMSRTPRIFTIIIISFGNSLKKFGWTPGPGISSHFAFRNLMYNCLDCSKRRCSNLDQVR